MAADQIVDRIAAQPPPLAVAARQNGGRIAPQGLPAMRQGLR